MKILPLFFVALLFCSCLQNAEGNSNNQIVNDISKSELRGLKMAQDFYGGKIEGNKLKNGSKSLFEVEISSSAHLERFIEQSELPSSHIAFIFYKSLKSERNLYSKIRVNSLFNDGSKTSFEFPIEDLKIVDEKLSVFNKVSDDMMEGKTQDIYSYLFLEVQEEIEIEEFSALLSKVNGEYGDISDLQFLGFSFFEDPVMNNRSMLHLSGMQIRRKENIPFSISIISNADEIENSIMELKFEL